MLDNIWQVIGITLAALAVFALWGVLVETRLIWLVVAVVCIVIARRYL